MSDLESLRDALTGSMTDAGFRDGTGRRLAYPTNRDANHEEVKTWAQAGESFACGLRAFTLRDAERVGVALSEAEYTLHADAGLSLSPNERVTVTDPRHPGSVTLELVRVMRGRAKTEALCRGVTT